MGHALLISNDEMMNDIYSVNLKVYVATSLTIKKNQVEAFKLLDQGPNIDAIITLPEIDEGPIAEEVHKYLLEHTLRVPLIILGNNSKKNLNLSNSVIIDSRYNLRGMVRAMARILGVTAKDMAESAVPDYYPIPCNILANMVSAPADLYMRVKSNANDALSEYEYLQLATRAQNLESIVGSLQAKKIETVYIPAADRLKVINLSSDIVLKKLSQTNLPTEEKIEIVSQGINMVAEQIFANPEEVEKISELSKTCTKSVMEVAERSTDMTELLKHLLKNKSHYSYSHGVLTAYLASQVIDQMSWGTAEQKFKVSYISMFHDLFLIPIYQKYPQYRTEEELMVAEDLEEPDRHTVIHHALLAAQSIAKVKQIPMGTDIIVRQHHGMPNGVGIATRYKDDISPLAKVIMIVEDYVNEILKIHPSDGQRPKGQDKPALKLNDIIENLRQKYPRQSYLKIIEALVATSKTKAA